MKDKDRDAELEKILSGLRNNKVDDLVLKGWQAGVQREMRPHSITSAWSQFAPKMMRTAAAFIIGLILGGLLISAKYHGSQAQKEQTTSFVFTATRQYIFAKTE